MRNLFVQMDPTPKLFPELRLQQSSRPDHQIFLVRRQTRISTRKNDFWSIKQVEGQAVAKVGPEHDRFQVMVTIRTLAQNFEEQIDLGRSLKLKVMRCHKAFSDQESVGLGLLRFGFASIGRRLGGPPVDGPLWP